ncbi:hypothetical protein BUALT_Bualt04G0077100 [Buddleja alternifolia]|uniref:Cupin type-1 domain-containing protein n=1 Tax=Buddleja alternifolia TaxID=168488 RepID=A0AAV6XM63_9LAMI|nr:hypothetical protein BUALT_Bualt04G0077100 [Buddleja alternifolia]
MLKKSSFASPRTLFLHVFLLWFAIWPLIFVVHGEEGVWPSGPMVKREERKSLVSTEYGEISAVRVRDNINGSYLLHFFTLEPNALLLPVILHDDMVFYVHTGSGRLSWTEEDDLKGAELKRGDVCRLQEGTAFFIQSNLQSDQTERQKLRIHAIFANSNADLHERATEPYSSIRDMVLGFHSKVLQAAFKVPEEVIDELMNGTKPPAILHRVPETKRTSWEMEAQFIRGLLGSTGRNVFELNKKKKKESAKLFNLFKEDKDFENCNGWSTTVTRKKLSALKGSNIGLFMVNLTTGSMMGPHWNPMASEIGVVLQGRGMVRVVCPSISNETLCRNMRYEVEEGDIFAVPRFHPMAQMAFNNDTFVFMGFSTSAKKNHPQYLAGKASVLRTLDKDVLAMSFNVTNTTLDGLLAKQDESVILGCVSCAEEEMRIMEEEREREEAREREEEEERRRQEEKRREEEEARRREEEAARREEEERKKREEEEEEEEEERHRQEEEEKRREEEEAEARQREEEEAGRRKQEEAEARRREEEEARGQEQEEVEAREREEQEAAASKSGEEEARQREEEAARQREGKEEARRREQEEEAARQREQEKARRREQEEEAARQREQEKARRREQEEEAARQREQEKARRREQEEAEAREREEEEARRAEEEEARQRAEEEARRREQEEAEAREREEEEARRAEEEEARQRAEEEARRREEEKEAGRSEGERAAEEERKRQEEAEREEEEQRGGRGR